ncbi:chloride channel protein CLC-a-like [Phragmites australis]|uniref:chloride channel protein CLC-a-like n=1 Tax=Phragmites australis TaxID=29695 RepID=UPI002D786719|nr:chloride channel protein CLC-a-like [Phragmites australis]
MEEEQSPGVSREPTTSPGPVPEVECKHEDGVENPEDPESTSTGNGNGISSLEQPLLKRSTTLTASHLAIVGAKVSHIESLDYEIIENDLFKHDWRSRSNVEVLQYIFLKWAMAFLVGLLTGVIASLINLAIENISGLKMLHMVNLVREKRYWAGFFYFAGLNFALTFVAALLCVVFAPTAAGPGIPEIKAYLNGVDTPNMFGAPQLIVKIIGSIGAVSSGLDLGKEGPLVHIGACLANLLNQGGEGRWRLRWRWLRYFNNDRDRRDLITCGASSGVCAAFRSPVGGVLFALEEVATWWRSALLWRTFFSTATVVVVLRGFIEVCRNGRCGMFGEGGLIIFDVSDVTVPYHVGDLLPVTVVGVLGGLLGSLYNHVLHKVLRLYNLINAKGRMAKLALALAVCVFTSAGLYVLPFTVPCTPCDPAFGEACPTVGKSGNFKQFNCPAGYYNDLASLLHATNVDATSNIFSTGTSGEFRLDSLLIFFAIYCVLGLFTFGIAVPSGLFLPIILMGSAYGRILALVLDRFVHIDHGLYAVLGAAALMSGSMRMTVSLCVIFLELTNNLLLLPVTMFVLLIAKTVGDAFNPSIYEIILDLKGLPFLEPKPEPWMKDLTVGELAAAKPRAVTLQVVEKVSTIVEVLRSTSHNGFPVLDRPRPCVSELHGLVLRSHLVAVLKKRWFLPEKRRTEDWEARERFSSTELAEKAGKIDDVELTPEELDMYIDLHPFTNTTPYTVVETMSVAKAVVLFRSCALRHMLIIPKFQGPEISSIVGILTRQDLRAHNILGAFPHLANKRKAH